MFFPIFWGEIVVELPVLFVNFKVYQQGFGKNALTLAKLCQEVAKKTGVSIVPVVSPVDVRLVASSVSVPVFSQHVDPVSFGKGNGKILPEALKEAGAAGVVVNHAEDPVSDEVVRAVIERSHGIGLEVLACAENDSRARSIAEFSPDFLAIELPELIGTLKSISRVDPDLVARSVKAIFSVNDSVIPIMGAGVASSEDTRASLALGTKGVFLAAAVVPVADPKTVMLELANGFTVGTKR